jgi:hypothetical protein
MDSSIIANLEDVPAVNNFLQTQASYMNYNSALYQAQEKSAAYMAMKQRKPMVIEYYSKKNADGSVDVESVEMYINPSRLNISTQKLKGKMYTRGGIFYHHWGDDHWQLQLSGYTGFSGMRGIEQLEKIYHHSGALLRYTDLGPEYVHSDTKPSTYEVINMDNIYETVNYLVSNGIGTEQIDTVIDQYNSKIDSTTSSNVQVLNSTKYTSQIMIKVLSVLRDVIQLAKNAGKCNELYIKLTNFISQNQQNGNFVSYNTLYQQAQIEVKQLFPNENSQVQLQIAQDMVNVLSQFQNDSKYDISLIQQLGTGFSDNFENISSNS